MSALFNEGPDGPLFYLLLTFKEKNDNNKNYERKMAFTGLIDITMIRNLIAVIVVLTVLLGPTCPALADGSWAEIAAGGIQFKKNKDISIEKEELYISQDLIRVEYSFKNHSDKDLRLLFAFPVPSYIEDVLDGYVPNYDDFSVWVNGKKIRYKKEVRAFVDGRECTDTLIKMKISIEDFGKNGEFLSNLSKADEKRLTAEKIIGTDGYDSYGNPNSIGPLWEVCIKYYWEQSFPAKGTILIKHEYKPNAGGGIIGYENGVVTDVSNHKVRNFACLGKEAVDYLIEHRKNEAYDAVWVSYILSTANNWKKPIKKFHLIVDTKEDEILGLCFDGEVKKTGPHRYESFLKDYSPKQDMTAVFIKTGRM